MVFLNDYKFAILRVRTRLLSSYNYFRGCSTVLLLRLCALLAMGGETALWGWEMGILGKWSLAAGATTCGFWSFSSYPPSSFQLFLFLLGDGLVNLVFLSALKRFSPLCERCIFISYPTSAFLLFKKSLKLAGLFEFSFASSSTLFAGIVMLGCFY